MRWSHDSARRLFLDTRPAANLRAATQHPASSRPSTTLLFMVLPAHRSHIRSQAHALQTVQRLKASEMPNVQTRKKTDRAPWKNRFRNVRGYLRRPQDAVVLDPCPLSLGLGESSSACLFNIWKMGARDFQPAEDSHQVSARPHKDVHQCHSEVVEVQESSIASDRGGHVVPALVPVRHHHHPLDALEQIQPRQGHRNCRGQRNLSL